jgi:predicted anti-sigma-YlaC factor YlaD
VFAGTHHESPERIRAAAIEWVGWLGGILGAVLLAVALVSWLA